MDFAGSSAGVTLAAGRAAYERFASELQELPRPRKKFMPVNVCQGYFYLPLQHKQAHEFHQLKT